MDQTLMLCLLVVIFGLLVTAGILFFGLRVFSITLARYWIDHPFFMRLTEEIRHPTGATVNASTVLRHVSDAYGSYLERRNEYWTTYGQVIVAVLIIIIISILLLTKTIQAEAGLPILSAISGFAIAKGVATTRSSSGGGEPDQRG